MSTDEQTFTATRTELLDALTHLIADVPWPSEADRDGTITIDAESMADAIIKALADRRRHTVHYHWPVLCGQFSASAGDTWSGNSGDVTCTDCLSRRECPKPIACASGPLAHIETPDCGPDRT